MARKSWRCFHCDKVFTSPKHAAEHFGTTEAATPACKLGDNSGLITLLRQQEKALTDYRNEDSALLRGWQEAEAKWRAAHLRNEEAGYARGVRDVLKMYRDGTIDQLLDKQTEKVAKQCPTKPTTAGRRSRCRRAASTTLTQG